MAENLNLYLLNRYEKNPSVLAACNSKNDEDETEMKDPTETQPVSDAIPDSMKLVNDSVIVPNATPATRIGSKDSGEHK